MTIANTEPTFCVSAGKKDIDKYNHLKVMPWRQPNPRIATRLQMCFIDKAQAEEVYKFLLDRGSNVAKSW